LEVLAHRIVWSIPLLVLFITFGRQWQKLPGRTVSWLLLCSVLLTINWLVFIYGIHAGKIAETSLGYFITPLVNVLLGALILKESLSVVQWYATGLAGIGVAGEIVSAGYFPWIALSLAFSFGFYGLIRRQLNVPSALGLGIETSVLAPIAILFIFMFAEPGRRDLEELALLAAGGVVTAVPLVCFGAAARRLKLSMLSNFQYLAPTISLFIAIYLYGEAVSPGRWMSFVCVWLAVAMFVWDEYRRAAASKVSAPQ
jgi:chloramphenicol-sensitive protein RarD